MTLQACDYANDRQIIWATADTPQKRLVFWRKGEILPCLASDSANRVYLKPCDGTPNIFWTENAGTIKNNATGRCLSGNNAGEVYTATCDGAINRNWTFLLR